jgi:hypothetical protein
VLISNAVNALAEAGQRLLAFEDHYNRRKFFTYRVILFTKWR